MSNIKKACLKLVWKEEIKVVQLFLKLFINIEQVIQIALQKANNHIRKNKLNILKKITQNMSKKVCQKLVWKEEKEEVQLLLNLFINIEQVIQRVLKKKNYQQKNVQNMDHININEIKIIIIYIIFL